MVIRIDPACWDELVADLWESGTTGIVEEEGQVQAFFDDATDLTSFTKRYPQVVLERVEQSEFPGAYETEGWDPIYVGKRFFITPPWFDEPTPDERLRIDVNATSAFGTGRHESTQLMLEVMEEELRPTDTVLDVGCGSGILTQAAKLLGAASVVSCDIDVDSVLNAREHVPGIYFAGSVDALTAGIADLLLVNISAKVLDNLARDLRRAAKPDARLILAGFVRESPPTRFEPRRQKELGDWQCWLCHSQDLREADMQDDGPTVHPKQWW